jgi:hypothetical protein
MKKQEQLLNEDKLGILLLSAAELQSVDGGWRPFPDPSPTFPLISFCKIFPSICRPPKTNGKSGGGGGTGSW